MICRDDSALRVFPVLPLDYETALRYAFLRLEKGEVETTWTMALLPQHRNFSPLSVVEGMICEERRTQISAPPAVVFAVFTGIGGKRGWFYADWLWKIRAAIDRVLGGVGMRRGRRDPEALHQGEPLEVWRVERIIEGRLLLLRAEMFLPGRAWLQFESLPSGPAGLHPASHGLFRAQGILGARLLARPSFPPQAHLLRPGSSHPQARRTARRWRACMMKFKRA